MFAKHVLFIRMILTNMLGECLCDRKSISVFMKDKITSNLTNIANYGEEYKNDGYAINVLFHGYGHYELLETSAK